MEGRTRRGTEIRARKEVRGTKIKHGGRHQVTEGRSRHLTEIRARRRSGATDGDQVWQGDRGHGGRITENQEDTDWEIRQGGCRVSL